MSALQQAFYLSQAFRDLRSETRDLRQHPVLGGISSTRWHAFETFTRSQSRLAAVLADRPSLRPAIQLVTAKAREKQPVPPTGTAIRSWDRREAQLDSAGMLAGDVADNHLRGSNGPDVLLGLHGRDRIAGEGGGDILCGGGGPDLFAFSRRASSAAGVIDEITDFRGEQGDRLLIRGASRLIGTQPFSGTPGEVAAVVWMADLTPDHQGPIQPWMIQGMQLSLDRDGDRQADLTLALPGISQLDPGWLILR